MPTAVLQARGANPPCAYCIPSRRRVAEPFPRYEQAVERSLDLLEVGQLAATCFNGSVYLVCHRGLPTLAGVVPRLPLSRDRRAGDA